MKQPIRPKNPIQEKELSSENPISLQDILDLAKEGGLEPHEVFIEAEMNYNYGDEYAKLKIYYNEQEYTPEKYEQKLQDYKLKLKAYNKWRKEEFPKIEKERLDREIAKLEDQKSKL